MNEEHREEAVSQYHGGRFLTAIAITSVTFIAEIVGGLLAGSLALLSDAAHVFLDVFALGLSYFATRVALLPASNKHTYGFGRMKIIAAAINGVTLVVVAVVIGREAWTRLHTPHAIESGPMLFVALVGLAFVLRRHDHSDLNTRSAFLHVLGDLFSSIGVVVAAVLIRLTGVTWIDSLTSALIALVIFAGSVKLLRDALHILNEGSPAHVDVSRVRDALAEMSRVRAVHDLHVWSVGPDQIILSAHVVLEDSSVRDSESVIQRMRAMLSDGFGIHHVTIQPECDSCDQECLTVTRNVPAKKDQ